jgi:LysM repeat protein
VTATSPARVLHSSPVLATRHTRAIAVVVGLLGSVVALAAPASASSIASDLLRAPAPAPPGTYVVKAGDSLGGIARRLQVPLADLLAANGLDLTSVIHPGDVLTVPVPPDPNVSTTAAPLSYVVVAGDSIFGLAKKLGVTVPALLATNSLTMTSVLRPGQSLVIPEGGRRPDSAPVTPPATAAPPAAPTSPAPTTPAAAPTTPYIVVNGDFLAGIARTHGVTLGALLAANELKVSSVIVPGMVLDIPPATLPLPEAPITPSSTLATKTDALITFLRAQVGKPYAFNAAGPDKYDCSGLVVAAYDLVGIGLPHQSLMQSTRGTAVDFLTQPLLPGDLVFQFSSASPNVIGHVGIVIDGSHWIQAAGSGVPVSIGWLPPKGKIQAVRRILQP